MKPNHAQLLRRARQAYKAGHVEEADHFCERILAESRRSAEALFLLGCIRLDQGRLDEASRCLERCVTLKPKEVAAHLLLGRVQAERGQYRAALTRVEKVLKLQPNLAEAICGKAEVFDRRGEPRRVLSLLEPIARANALTAGMALLLARALDRETQTEEAMALITRQARAPGIDPEIRRRLLLLQGSIHERRAEHDAAFAAYADANRDAVVPDDPDRYRRRVDELIATFSRERLAALPRGAHGHEEPVLIVGMPRTGSTLLERIIDAHPAAHGAGEIDDMVRLIGSISLTIESTLPYPACVEDLDAGDVDRLGRTYVEGLVARGGGAERIVDKFLENYEHLGLLALIAPAARVIDCRRRPIDTCFSCFTTALPRGLHPYAADLEHLGLRYRAYDRLMTHWRDVLDGPLLTVEYEEVVADPEAASRRVIEFLGLPWDDRCLQHHATGRSALTLSRDQVRRPVYATSVNRADAFAAHLEPLRRALSGEG